MSAEKQYANIPTLLSGKFQIVGEFLDKISKLRKFFGTLNLANFNLFAPMLQLITAYALCFQLNNIQCGFKIWIPPYMENGKEIAHTSTFGEYFL